MVCHTTSNYRFYNRIRIITTIACLLLFMLCSHRAVASTTLLVPLKLESKKTTTDAVESQASILTPMSLSSINGQEVLVLDEATASKLKESNNPVPISLKSLGESSEQQQQEADPTEKKHPLLPEILFYDPRDGKKPKKIFDKEGKVVKVDLEKHDVLIFPPNEDEAVDESSSNVESNSTLTSSTASINSTKRKTTSQSSSKRTEAEYQAHDQMIIISTVATMAIFVGALSARKLRARQFLNSCIENEALEEEVAYDAAYTTEETGGSYNSFGNHYRGGDLRWRGDLEKFDV